MCCRPIYKAYLTTYKYIMKGITRLLTILLMSGLWCVTACKRETTELPEKEMPPSVAELAAKYKEALVANAEGWYLLYKPVDTVDGIAIRIKFGQDDGLSILSGWRGYHEERTDAVFSFEGSYAPHLVFSENSVFGELARTLNGFNKFKIEQLDNGDFSLKRSDGYDNATFILTKVNAENTLVLNQQVQAVLDEIAYEAEMARLTAEAVQKLASLVESDPGYYFRNLLLDNFGAYLDQIDTTARSITLTWPSAGGAAGVSHTLAYRLVPGGMALNPVIVQGSYTIDTLKFGDFADGALEITAAGNAGAGKLGWMHVPAYPYQAAIAGAPATYTTADLFIRNNELPRFMGYTLDDMDIYYSPALQPYINDLKTYFDGQGFRASELFRLQFYNNNYNATTLPNDHATRNQLQLLVRNAAGTSTFQVFFYDLQKLGPDHVSMVSFGTSSTGSAPYKDKVVEFMNEVFTEEGFTVVPAGRNGTAPTALQKLRLVSRKDSRIWLELLANSPTGIYFN